MSSNNESTDNDTIDRLTAELEELTLQRNNIERRRSRVYEQLQALRGNTTSNEYTLYKPLNVIANRIDCKGRPLRVNDRISFNTPGVQTTSQGKVKGFGKCFVKCVDDRGFPVNKEPKSLTKIEAQEEDTEQ